MRLAFVSIMSGAAWAACEELWADAARQALLAGHEVLVSVYERAGSTPQVLALQAAGAKIDLRSMNRWVRKSAVIAKLSGTFSALEQFDADSICVSQGGTYDIARSGNMRVLRNILAHQSKPYVLLCHCQQDAPRRAKQRRARKVLPQAAVLGMLSNNLGKLSERHLNVRLENVRIFQNPLKLRDCSPLPWPPNEILRLAFVGRLEHVKGLDLLIDALATPAWRQRPWKLTICGAGPDRSTLEQRVSDAGLGKRIEFAGFVNNIVDVWKEHHVLVMSSRLEGIPIALTEAMLCGRPVVASDVGGIREALVDGKSGFLIEQPALPQVMAALERLWEQRGALESMGRVAFDSTVAARDGNPGGTLVKWLTANPTASRPNPA
jgi:glycosyltransferase involved in cell wall biosynthesis